MITVAKHTKLQLLAGGLFAVCCFTFFQSALPYHLFFKEEMQLFLLTGEHFLSYAGKPAWLACYAGDFLTQFFYLRGVGALTLTLVLCAEYTLWAQVLRRLGRRRYAAVAALLPAAADGFMHCGLYYGLPTSLSIILTLLAFEAFTLIKRPAVAFAAGVLLLPGLYIAAGASFLLFPLLAGVYSWRRGNRFAVVALLLIAAACPAIARPYYLLTPGQAYSYPFPSSINLRGVDRTREKILALSVEAGRGRWDEVGRRAAEAAGLSNPIVTYFANIAASKQGRLPDSLLNYYQPFTRALFLPVSPQSDWLTISFSQEVFFHLGDMNMAQHSAMLGMIFSPRRRSSRMLERLAGISLANGDVQLADKYLRMLDATLFHRSHGRVLHMSHGGSPLLMQDTLRTASDYATSLELLAGSCPDGGCALDYLLCYHLLNKDIRAFATVYDRYLRGKEGYVAPRLYAEAMLIRLAAEKAPAGELQAYGIDPGIVSDFMEYTRLYEQNNAAPGVLSGRFGRGYWFYYHFARKREEGEV
ncbi:MAG: DUF6057 family protein [Tannerellaceae bacterium]|jgi:hypothetical protein|nr:DUF6057 family protein [Tannerellaceae bacterium]